MGAMYLLHVSPIERGITKDELSYYSAQDAPPGTLVSVPLRNKQVLALVTAREELTEAKARVRTAPHQFKKIASVYDTVLCSASFMAAAHRLAHEHAGTIGAILHTLTPKSLREEPKTLTAGTAVDMNGADEPANIRAEKQVLQAPYAERLEIYRSLIRESIARRGSVLICVPTIQEGEALAAALKRGIEKRTFLLHSALTKKQQREQWHAAATAEYPVCAIVTGAFLALPRTDYTDVIIEHENSRYFKLSERPFVDVRRAAEYLSEHLKARCIISDMPLRIETIWRASNYELDELRPPTAKVRSSVPLTTISLAASKTENTEPPAPPNQQKNTFTILSDTLRSAIQEAHADGKNTFLLTARRGIASTIVCQDCGQLVSCEHCGASMTLHTGAAGAYNTFRCHSCGATRTAHERCVVCRSWRLKELGVGTERVVQALEEIVDANFVHTLTRDTVTTHKKARSTMETFMNTPGSILCGTEMALPYLREYTVPVSGVPAFDALLSAPTFRIHERVFTTLLTVREHTTDAMYLQTRHPEEPLIHDLENGAITEFATREMQLRRQLRYPPFSVLIVLACTGTSAQRTKDAQYIQERLRAYQPLVIPDTRGTSRGAETHILLRVPTEQWPDEALIHKLKEVPPRISVNVHPETL